MSQNQCSCQNHNSNPPNPNSNPNELSFEKPNVFSGRININGKSFTPLAKLDLSRNKDGTISWDF